MTDQSRAAERIRTLEDDKLRWIADLQGEVEDLRSLLKHVLDSERIDREGDYNTLPEDSELKVALDRLEKYLAGRENP